MFQFWGNFGAHFGARDLTLLKMFGQHFWATFSGRKFPPKNSAQKLHHLRAANPFGGQGKEGKGKGKWRERGGRGRERERARGKRRGKRKGTGSESSVDSLTIYGHFGPCLRSEAILFCKSKLYHQLTLDPSAVNTSSDTSSKVKIFWALLVLGPADWSWLISVSFFDTPPLIKIFDFSWGAFSKKFLEACLKICRQLFWHSSCSPAWPHQGGKESWTPNGSSAVFLVASQISRAADFKNHFPNSVLRCHSPY